MVLSLKLNSHVILQTPGNTAIHALLRFGFNLLLRPDTGHTEFTITLNVTSNNARY